MSFYLTVTTAFYLSEKASMKHRFHELYPFYNQNATLSVGRIRRLLREQHESEDPAAVTFREETEAVPAESEVFCRSDCDSTRIQKEWEKAKP
ncbi:hypothetical protein GCM10027286_27990 [Virgibacillus ainsalahensis]